MTLLLLTVTVLLGILTTGRFATGNWPRFLTVGLHRNLSLLTVVFVALHVATTVVDTFTAIPLTAAFVPFSSSYKTFWLGLGAVALDLLIALVATSLIRNRLGVRAWRGVHWAAYACWPVALAHGLGAGTDRSTLWVFVLTVASAAVVAGVATWRFVGAALGRCPVTSLALNAYRAPELLLPRLLACVSTTTRPGWPSTRNCTGRCRCPRPRRATAPGGRGPSF